MPLGHTFCFRQGTDAALLCASASWVANQHPHDAPVEGNGSLWDHVLHGILSIPTTSGDPWKRVCEWVCTTFLFENLGYSQLLQAHAWPLGISECSCLFYSILFLEQLLLPLVLCRRVRGSSRFSEELVILWYSVQLVALFSAVFMGSRKGFSDHLYFSYCQGGNDILLQVSIH